MYTEANKEFHLMFIRRSSEMQVKWDLLASGHYETHQTELAKLVHTDLSIIECSVGIIAEDKSKKICLLMSAPKSPHRPLCIVAKEPPSTLRNEMLMDSRHCQLPHRWRC